MLFALQPAARPSALSCNYPSGNSFYNRLRGLFILLFLLAAFFLGNLPAVNAQFINFSGSYYAGQPVPASSAPNPGGVMPASGTTPSATSQDTPNNQYVPGLTMDFLKSSPPAPIVAANGFSVRWTASFRATTSGSYTFSTTSSAGVRVYINGTKVVDNWYYQSATPASGTIALSGGMTYPVVVEYFYGGTGAATLNLSYTTPQTAGFYPTQLTATPGNSQVALSWTAPTASNTGANPYYPLSGYTVSYSTSPGGEAAGTTTGQFAGTTKTITGLTNGVTYYFIVTAYFSGGSYYSSALANSEASATPNAAPGAPTGITTTPGYNQMTVSWTPPSGPVTSYSIAYKPDSATTYSYDYTPGGVTSTVVSGLTGGTLYDFYVFAANTNVYGASSAVSKNTPLQPAAPAAPTGVTAQPQLGQVWLTWTPPAGPVTGYTIAYRQDPSGNYSYASSGSAGTTITGLSSSILYDFYVSALNQAGQGPYSSPAAQASALAIPAAPTSLAATPGNAQVTLTWTAPAGTVTSYNVKRSPATGGPYTTISTAGSVTATSYTDTTVSNRINYYYVVTAVDAAGEGPNSNEAGATPDVGDDAQVAAAPSFPAAMTSGQVATATVTMRNIGTTTWPSGTPYFLGMVTAPGTSDSTWGSPGYAAVTPAAVGRNGTQTFSIQITAPTVTQATSVPIRFQMFHSGGAFFGDATTSASITVTPPVPGAPGGLTATPGNGQVTLVWTAPSGPVAKYQIAYSQNNTTQTFTIPAPTPSATSGTIDNVTGPYTVSGSTTTFTVPVTGLSNRMNYYFQVRAVNDGGPGAPTPVVGATPDVANDAQFVSETLSSGAAIPATMTAGQQYSVAVTMRNIGTSSWTVSSPGSGYFLGSANPSANTTWMNPYYIASTAATPRNGTQTFTFTITAPSTPGTYNLQWQMFLWGSPYFGDTTPNLSVAVNALAAPTGLSAVAGNAQVALTWTAPSGPVTSYNVKRSPATGGPYTTISTAGSVTGTTYTDSTVTNRTNYYYVVTAVDPLSESPNSNEAGVTPDVGDDAQFVSQTLSNGSSFPTTMTVGQQYSVAVTMRNIGTSSWTVSSPGSGYFLGSANPSSNTTWASPYYVASTAATPRNGTQTFVFTITAPSTPGTYNFQRQMFHWGYPYFGDPSANLAITVNPPAPSAPTNLTATAGSTQVTLNWTAPSGTVTSYNVKRGSTSQGPFTTVSTTGSVTGTTYADTGLTNRTNYFYVVTAVGAGGESGNSNVVGITPCAPDDAVFVSETLSSGAAIPTTMIVGQQSTISVTMQNIGTSPWIVSSPGSGYFLGSANPGANTTWINPYYVASTAATPRFGSQTFTFTITAPSTPGTYNLQWQMFHWGYPYFGDTTPNLSITVNPAPDFSLSASPASLTIAQGRGGATTISLKNISGFSSSVALTVSGLPTGVTAAFNPTSVSGTATSTLTLTASATASVGTTAITITGTSGTTTHTTTVNLTIAANPILTSIVVSPTPVSLNENASQTFTAVAKDQNGNTLSPQPAFAWTVDSGGVGTITSAGVYSAGTTAGNATVRATSGAVSGVAAVTVLPPTLISLVLSPTSVSGGESVMGTVKLSGPAPQGGATVTLISGNTSVVGLPTSQNVVVKAQSNIASFILTTNSVNAATPVTISATYGTTQNATVTVNPPVAMFAYRVDVGNSGNFTDSSGNPWTPETGLFQSGTAVASSGAVNNVSPLDAALYQTQRVGASFTYTLSVPNGNYLLALLFAEVDGSVTGAGQRVCTVTSNGLTLLNGFDTYAAVGPNMATTQVVPVTVTGGSIALTFTGTGSQGTAAVAALQLGLMPAGGGITPYIPGVSQPVPDVPAPGWGGAAVPTDGSSDSGGMGPSMGGPVSLASGVEENQPGPDLWSYNPLGPAVSYERIYRSQRPSRPGYQSPGLSPGWTDSNDMSIIPGSGSYTLYYPNDGTDVWNGTTGALTATKTGTPYLMTQTPGSGGNSATITMTQKGRSRTTFTQIAAAGGNYAAGTYLMSGMTNLVGHFVTINRDPANGYRVLSLTNDAGTALLTFSYAGSQLASVTDKDGRAISYGFSGGGNLASVSQINAPGALRWQYGYVTSPVAGSTIPLLSSVGAPDPSNPGSLSAPSVTLFYDRTGAVASHMDAIGTKRAYSYVPASGGAVQVTGVTVTNANGTVAQTWKHKIGPSNVEVGTVDAGNNATSTQYYGPYLPSVVTNEIAQAAQALYDNYGNPTSVTDPRGIQVNTQFSYPSDFALGQPAQVQQAYIPYTPGTLPNPSTPPSSLLTATTLSYYGVGSAFNGLVSEVDTPTPDTVTASGSTPAAPGIKTQYSYDTTNVNGLPLGNVSTIIGPSPNGPLGTTVSYAYTNTAVTVPALGEPVSVTVTGTAPSAVSAGLPTINTQKATFTYDSRGNTLSVTDASGYTTSFLYNLADQQTSVIYPATGAGSGQAHTDTFYQYLGGPAYAVVVYDENGNAVREVDTTYDAEGQVTSVTGSTQPSSYAYDGRGRVVQMADGNSHITNYAYDPLGNLSKVYYPNAPGGTNSFDTETYSYDAAHNLTAETDGRGLTTAYSRINPATNRQDPDNLVYAKSYLNVPASVTSIGNVSYSYDVFGRRSSMADGTGTAAYNAYDDNDVLQSMTRSFAGGPQSQTMSFAHNPDGSRRVLGTPGNVANPMTAINGGSFSYLYDGMGRLAQLNVPFTVASNGNPINGAAGDDLQHQYQANGWLTQTSGLLMGSASKPSTATAYGYNPRGFLTTLSNQQFSAMGGMTTTSSFAGSTPLGMPYDAVGNRLGLVASIPAPPGSSAPDASRSVSFAYDTAHSAASQNRDVLTGEASSPIGSGSSQYNDNYTNNFGYDGAYNPSTFALTGSVFSYPPNADNQINVPGFGFDGDGNPTTYENYAFSFDPEDRLTSAPALITGGTFSASYDGDGLRATKTAVPIGGSSPVTTYFLYDGNTPILEEQVLAQGPAFTAVNVEAADGIRARYSQTLGSQFYSFDYDPQGSLIGSQYSGNTVTPDYSTSSFEAYGHRGAQIGNNGSLPGNQPPFEFGGQYGYYTDVETGLLCLTHRYYDPGTGKFINRDPIGYAGGANLYGFCDGNPVNSADPDGTDVIILTWQGGNDPAGEASGDHSGIAVSWPGSKTGFTEFDFGPDKPDSVSNFVAALHYLHGGTYPGQVVPTVNFDPTRPDVWSHVEHPSSCILIKTTPAQDKAMRKWLVANKTGDEENANKFVGYGPYNGLTHQCANFVLDALKAGGVDMSKFHPHLDGLPGGFGLGGTTIVTPYALQDWAMSHGGNEVRFLHHWPPGPYK